MPQPPYPSISWKQDQLDKDLNSLADYAIALANWYREYYTKGSPAKKNWAKWLRAIAILATALGGIIPILSQMEFKILDASIDPAWSTVFISLAIAAIGLDRFFGFSSAWMRYITADIKLGGKIEQFRLTMENQRFSWGGQQPDFEKGQTMLTIIVSFITEISEIVRDETNTWMVEFQSAIQKFNEEVNVKAESSKLGSVVINIENSNKFDKGLRIEMEGQQPVTNFFGSSYSLNNLYPKAYRLVVIGTYTKQEGAAKVEKKVRAETVIVINPGAVTTQSVTLQMEDKKEEDDNGDAES